MVPSLPLLSCDSSVSVKVNPDRKKKKKKANVINNENGLRLQEMQVHSFS